jgi:glycosyltransferase involved in cell wall biosynthesis
MKILQVTNRPRQCGAGGDVVVDQTVNLLKKEGIFVRLWEKKSKGLDESFKGKLKAFFSGIYSISSHELMTKILNEFQPDIVHVHRIYPLLSPSIFLSCRKAHTPVVITYHSFYMTCPANFHFSHGKICDRCISGREYWCILRNCRNNILESTAYAIRTASSRLLKLIKKNITLIIALTKFAKSRLIEIGFNPSQIMVVPNSVILPEKPASPENGGYVAYAGRVSSEKGLDSLINAAARISEVPFRIAGDGPILLDLVKAAPPNVEFLGWMDHNSLGSFLQGARLLVLPTKCYEMCPMTVLEAMSYGLPVITSPFGGLSEIVKDGASGLLVEPGNPDYLAKNIHLLWENTELCQQMGAVGREKVNREYREDLYYKRLISVYEKAIEINNKML